MLTAKQKRLLDYLVEQVREGETPSYREMADAVGLRSVSGVHRLMTSLDERGFIRRIPRRARAVEVVKMSPDDNVSRLACLVAEIPERGYADRGSYVAVLVELAALASRNGIDLADLPERGEPELEDAGFAPGMAG
jgi:SOS-response transcriptional repressor LexA